MPGPFSGFINCLKRNGRQIMQLDDYSILKEYVLNSDMILVGLGEEWVLSEEEILLDLVQKNKSLYRLFSYVFESEEYKALSSAFIAYYTKKYIPEKYKKAYENLLVLLEEKNYFIVSLTIDSYLKQFGFKTDRFVNPCGTYDLLQCDCGCTDELQSSEALFKIIDNMVLKINRDDTDLSSQQDEIKCILDKIRDEALQYKCKNCGQKLTFNTLDSVKYREEGYLENWQTYMKWLQGTVNRKLCVIEAGAGMKLPSVIRWPFEKTVYYNQKSNMFRVHEKFYQVNEEMAERTFGCKCNAVQLFCKESVEASL